MAYNAFISYSHAADGGLAPALQSALHRLAKPWYRLRALTVFRDKTSLSASPELWPSIERALKQSEWFLLMASPEAAGSRWIAQEVGWWLKNRTAARMLIAVTDGEVNWNAANRDFDWDRTTAVPRQLQRCFDNEPLYVDLRWAKSETHLSLRHTRFRSAVLDLAATLHGKPKDELDGEDVQQHRKAKALVWTAAVALTTLTILSVISAYLAIQQSRIATSRELSVSSGAQLGSDPELSVLLATEAVAISPTEQSRTALRRALFESRARSTLSIGGAIWGVAISPDGRRIATAGADRLLRLWRTDTLTLSATLAGHLDTIESVAFDATGRYLATTSQDHVLRAWDLTRETSLLEVSHASGLVTPESFSSDGGRIVTGGDDGIARIWDVSDGHLVAELRGHSGSVLSAGFSSDDAHIATSGSDGSAKLWASRDWSLERTWQLGDTAVTEARVSPDGLYLVTSVLDGARVWSIASGELVTHLELASSPVRLLISPDSRRLLAVESLGTVATVWDLSSGRRVVDLVGHTGRIFAAAFGPSGDRVVTASEDNTARIWHIPSGHQVGIFLGHTNIVSAIALNPEGDTVVTGSLDGTARLWDASLGWPVRTFGNGATSVLAAAFSHERDGVAVAQVGSVACLWDIESGQCGTELRSDLRAARGAVFSRDRQLLATTDGDGVTAIWDARTGGMRHELQGHKGPITSVVFAPDGRFVATSSSDQTTKIWSLETGRSVVDLAGSLATRGSPITPDSRYILTTIDGRARISEVADGRMVRELRADTALRDAVFSPDGRQVLAAEGVSTLRLWDWRTGAEISHFSGSQEYVWPVAFSADSNLILSIAQDQTARVWTNAGRQVVQLRGDRGNWESATFSPDGSMVITSGGHNYVTIWDARTGVRLLELAMSNDMTVADVAADGSAILVSGSGHSTYLYMCPSCAASASLPEVARARRPRPLSAQERQEFLHERMEAASPR